MTRSGETEARLVGVDVARGLAVLGMFWAHVAPDGTQDGLADGRSSVLFATVAGVSLGLLTGGARPVRGAARGRAALSIGLRGVWLVVLGRLLWLLGSGILVILDSYGALFVVLLPVLLAPRLVLGAVVAACAIAGPLVVQGVGPAPDAALVTAGPLQWPAQWFVTGAYPGVVWGAYVCAGLIAARSDLAVRRTQLVLVGTGVAASVVGYGGAALLGADASAHSDTTWEVLGSGGLALAAVGALQLACSAPVAARALSSLAAVGSMPLTVYTGQLLVLALVAASGAGGDDPARSWWVLALLAAGSIAFAAWWRRSVGRGPMEQLLGSLSRTSRPAAGH